MPAIGILFSIYFPNTPLGDFINFMISFAPVMAPFVALFSALFVANMSEGREEKKILIGKQSNPPNLALYKGWLDTSEKYIDLANHKSAYGLTFLSDEYINIEAARKGALASLKWEREIEYLCSDSVVKSRISHVRPGLAERILSDKYKAVYLLEGDYFRPLRVMNIWYIIWGIMGITQIPFVIFFLDMNPFLKILDVILMIFCLYSLYLVRFKYLAYYEVHKADYWFRLITVEYYHKKLWVDYFAELNLMKERLRSAALLGFQDGYEGLAVYCPWEGKSMICKITSRLRAIVHPGYYVKRAMSGEEKEIWGAYKNNDLNGYMAYLYGIPDDSFLFKLEQEVRFGSPSEKSISTMVSRPASRYVPQLLRKSARASK